MLKNIKKSPAKIAVIFSVLYTLYTQFIMTKIFEVLVTGDWIPKSVYNYLLSHHIFFPTYLYWLNIVFYDGLMLVAIISGTIAILEASKTQRKRRWTSEF